MPTISKLQLIQNSAARLVTKMRVRDREHITPILRDLHWLPVSLRINFKILCIIFKLIHLFQINFIIDINFVKTTLPADVQVIKFPNLKIVEKNVTQKHLLRCKHNNNDIRLVAVLYSIKSMLQKVYTGNTTPVTDYVLSKI